MPNAIEEGAQENKSRQSCPVRALVTCSLHFHLIALPFRLFKEGRKQRRSSALTSRRTLNVGFIHLERSFYSIRLQMNQLVFFFVFSPLCPLTNTCYSYDVLLELLPRQSIDDFQERFIIVEKYLITLSIESHSYDL